jgi:hypothetical protein
MPDLDLSTDDLRGERTWRGEQLEPVPAGASRRICDAEIERVVVMTLEMTPRGAMRWSTRSMAAASGLTQTAVSRIWRALEADDLLGRATQVRHDEADAGCPRFARCGPKRMLTV